PYGLPLILVEIASILMMLVGASDNVFSGIYALIHFVGVISLTSFSRKRTFTKKEVYFLYSIISIHVLAPVMLTFNLDFTCKLTIIISSIPFWIASMCLLIFLAETRKTPCN
ncbi:MAG: hypothetical protein JWQ25_134, partial [Daejeonella sp.]|nr:hypothetical protein [Daejeonella sp.]